MGLRLSKFDLSHLVHQGIVLFVHSCGRFLGAALACLAVDLEMLGAQCPFRLAFFVTEAAFHCKSIPSDHEVSVILCNIGFGLGLFLSQVLTAACQSFMGLRLFPMTHPQDS